MRAFTALVIAAWLAVGPMSTVEVHGAHQHPPTTRTTIDDRVAHLESLLHGGQYAEAIAGIVALLEAHGQSPDRHASAATTNLTLLSSVVTGSFTVAHRLDPARLSAEEAGSYWYVKGVLEGRAAWPGGREPHLSSARQAAVQLDALAGVEGRWSRVEVRRASVLAAIAGAQEERDEMTLLLAYALDLDGQLRGAGLPDDPLLPVDELAADLWLQVHRFEDARRFYLGVTGRRPERTSAWLGLARAAHEAGATEQARHAASRVIRAWAGTPALASVKDELTAIAAPPR